VKKLAVLALPVVAVALAVTAVFASQDSVSAQPAPDGRVSIDCSQTQDPAEPDWVGEVTCTLTVDVPDPGTDVTLTLIVQYEDVDQSGTVTFGDRLICWEIPDLGLGTC
jgi:hypothetical protein